MRGLSYKQCGRDPERPNFIFSSDITSKVRRLSRRYRRRTVNDLGEEVVELAALNSVSFTLQVELNTLLLRNKLLKASDLLKENLISVAQSGAGRIHMERKGIDRPLPQLPAQPLLPLSLLQLLIHNKGVSLAILPYCFVPNEIFVVCLKLNALDFTVRRNEGNLEIELDFLKDESYGILVLCDVSLVEQTEEYIKTRFLKELDALNEEEVALQDTEEVDVEEEEEEKDGDERQDFQFDEIDSLNELEPIHQKYVTGYSTSSLDPPLEVIPSSPTINDISIEEPLKDKSYIYEDDEYDSSIEELNLLKSNDITRSNTQEEPQLINFNDIPSMNYSHSSNVQVLKKLNKMNIIEVKGDDKFLNDISNLRHNEHTKLDEIEEVSCDLDTAPSSPEKRSKPDTTNVLFEPSSPSPILKPRTSFVSPTKRKPSVSRKTLAASFSLINHDEEHTGLEYAFKSLTVPSYIKQDKKFKFIRVGKVQKFVNLFEEKKQDLDPVVPGSRHPTRPSSRQSTRPSSPSIVS